MICSENLHLEGGTEENSSVLWGANDRTSAQRFFCSRGPKNAGHELQVQLDPGAQRMSFMFHLSSISYFRFPRTGFILR